MPPNSSEELRLRHCHRLEVTVRGNNNEVKKITFLQRWEMFCALRSPILLHSLASDLQLKDTDHNKVGYNISKCMWIVNRKDITDLISGVVIKRIMISVNKNKTASFTTRIQR